MCAGEAELQQRAGGGVLGSGKGVLENSGGGLAVLAPGRLVGEVYMTSPAGFGIEIGAGGVQVDEGTWVSRVYTADIWGHHPAS
ncbi:hypothetical protein ACIHCQ_41680 [Streptomyces sp. NPDC052236]|uniref:hypothetical protein n=1 Tax=Streptomyces sp. NPDC052236 TaxID=3365686 RepID=UPI0037CD2F12